MPKDPRKKHIEEPSKTLSGRRADSQSWVDDSVIGEMAARLRAADRWDNNLADGYQLLKARIETLERFARYDKWAYEKIRRPLSSWQDCRKLLTIISSDRFSSFSDIAAPVEACLTLAVMLNVWEHAVEYGMRERPVPIPEDIRGMMHGAITVEWAKGKGVIIDQYGLHGEIP